MTTMNIGEEGFWWFVGIVEDREDPKKMGRVRVRIHNIHSEKETILPKDEIPWAIPLMPITSASSATIGVSPTGIAVGSSVFGFFMDGRSCQNPVIMGSFPGIPGNDEAKHDVAHEARGINKIAKTLVGPEPASPYASRYPYNKVLKTEGGHFIELDDTPGKERIHVYHKSGSYVEIDQSGRTVCKSVGDRFEIDVKDNNVYVGGNVNLTVQGNVTATISGSTVWKCPTNIIDGKLTVTGMTTIQGGLAVSGGSGTTATISGNLNVSESVTAPAFHGVADSALTDND